MGERTPERVNRIEVQQEQGPKFIYTRDENEDIWRHGQRVRGGAYEMSTDELLKMLEAAVRR
jgi:hypothetical protein